MGFSGAKIALIIFLSLLVIGIFVGIVVGVAVYKQKKHNAQYIIQNGTEVYLQNFHGNLKACSSLNVQLLQSNFPPIPLGSRPIVSLVEPVENVDKWVVKAKADGNVKYGDHFQLMHAQTSQYISQNILLAEESGSLCGAISNLVLTTNQADAVLFKFTHRDNATSTDIVSFGNVAILEVVRDGDSSFANVAVCDFSLPAAPPPEDGQYVLPSKLPPGDEPKLSGCGNAAVAIISANPYYFFIGNPKQPNTPTPTP